MPKDKLTNSFYDLKHNGNKVELTDNNTDEYSYDFTTEKDAERAHRILTDIQTFIQRWNNGDYD